MSKHDETAEEIAQFVQNKLTPDALNAMWVYLMPLVIQSVGPGVVAHWLRESMTEDEYRQLVADLTKGG